MYTTALGIKSRTVKISATGGGPKSDRLKKWFRLFVGFACIWAFMFVLIPSFDDLPVVKPLIDFIEERDMNATALFYSDAEETAEAQNYLINSKRFRP